MKKIAVVLCGMEYSNQQELVQGMIQYQSEHGEVSMCFTAVGIICRPEVIKGELLKSLIC